MTPQTFIFAGPSGSGKGTQVELLKEYLKKQTPDVAQFHSYTGDELRAFMRGETLAAKLTKEIQEAGGLQPEFLAVYLWAGNFIKNLKGGEHIFIDGSPRKLAEAMVLDSAMQFYKRSQIHLLLVNVSNNEAKRRLLLRVRHDDSTEEIDRRLSWYTTEVLPAVNYLKDRAGYIFHDIDGEQTPAEVHKSIIRALQL